MSSRTRTARLCLVLAAIAAVGLVAIPVASAKGRSSGALSSFEKRQNARIAKAKARISALRDLAITLGQKNAQQDFDDLEDDATLGTLTTTLAGVKGTVDAIVAGVPLITDALTAIQAALNNTTTGLVGLNLARPQFGAFNGADGVILGGTGQVTGASGPKTNATHPSTGTYIVDFGNDVSKRVLSVNVFPAFGPGPAPIAATAQAVDCGASADATTLCAAFGDTGGNPNHVAVLIQGQTQAGNPISPANRSFSVSAISG